MEMVTPVVFFGQRDYWTRWEAASSVLPAVVTVSPKGCCYQDESVVVVAIVGPVRRINLHQAACHTGCWFEMPSAVAVLCFVVEEKAVDQIDHTRWAARVDSRWQSHWQTLSAEAVHIDCSRNRCSGSVAGEGCQTSQRQVAVDSPG